MIRDQLARRASRTLALALVWGLSGCSSEDPSDGPPMSAAGMGARAGEAAAPPAGSSRPALCSRPQDDAVRDVFCGDERPVIASLADLQRLLRIEPDPAEQENPGLIGSAGVLLGHSTALSGQVVSPINPRAIIPGHDGDTFMAFQRGVQQVELASRRKKYSVFNFYLITFRNPCNQTEAGCLPGDRYTAAIENDWSDVEIQDDEDLKNTPSDCRQCHQRGRETPVLLMRELEAPWTHFFAHEVEAGGVPGPTGGDLVMDYRGAKGEEPYAGIPASALASTTGYALQFAVELPQPLLFDVPTIKDERWQYGPDGWPDEPARSPTWDRAYQAFKRGEQLALPYFDMRPTDPDKQARLSQAYQRYQAGELSRDELPDLADIFPDDARVRAEIGLQTEPDATPAEALIQACGSCHNDVLDQSISRARFNIGLARMDRAELEVAIARIGRDKNQPGVMPPAEARQLDPAVRAQLIDYLRQADFPDADRELLSNAARNGMTGTAQP